METTLLTAKKAKMIAETQEKLTNLLDQILVKALKSEYSLILSEEIPSNVIANLEGLGYKVEIRKLIKPLYIISWL
ncbi:hypothetical protein [uncultured Bacteroides sp.]|jgi:hypothetical protein|uniref:hypothetical protein n=1 Tax=uncultured Bacteroides sp. TaxID=162156 RepID=UPI002584F294|nr:hypothetical protein [uncultured Bacteroides sp.]